MDEILEQFALESKKLIGQVLAILEDIEGDYSKVKNLEQPGQLVDRIMGAAKTFGMGLPEEHVIHRIAAYSQVCKAVGYKASQIVNNERLFQACTAFLLDGAEEIDKMLDHLKSKSTDAKFNDQRTQVFLDRLNWVSEQFSPNVRATVATSKSKNLNAQINNLVKAMGT